MPFAFPMKPERKKKSQREWVSEWTNGRTESAELNLMPDYQFV